MDGASQPFWDTEQAERARGGGRESDMVPLLACDQLGFSFLWLGPFFFFSLKDAVIFMLSLDDNVNRCNECWSGKVSRGNV